MTVFVLGDFLHNDHVEAICYKQMDPSVYNSHSCHGRNPYLSEPHLFLYWGIGYGVWFCPFGLLEFLGVVECSTFLPFVCVVCVGGAIGVGPIFESGGGGVHSHLAWGFYRQTTVLFLPVKHQIIPIVRDITCILLLFFCTLLPFSIGFSDWPKGKGTQM